MQERGVSSLLLPLSLAFGCCDSVLCTDEFFQFEEERSPVESREPMRTSSPFHAQEY